MLWFYKRKGKEKTVLVSCFPCMPILGRKDGEEPFVCLPSGMCSVRVEQFVLQLSGVYQFVIKVRGQSRR